MKTTHKIKLKENEFSMFCDHIFDGKKILLQNDKPFLENQCVRQDKLKVDEGSDDEQECEKSSVKQVTE